MFRQHSPLLAEVARAFSGRTIVVIGAAALQWHYARFRGTLDLDICVAIDLDEHGRAEVLPGSWRRAASMPHRYEGPSGQLLDIIPASAALLAAGSVTWSNGMTLDLTGIDLVMRDHARWSDELPVHVKVATRRALFVTKVAAWLDRPNDRQKDLGDLALLLDQYVGDDEPRRFDEPALEGREWDERPAFLLGMDLRAVCGSRHEERISAFAQLVGAPHQREHAWMLAAAPPAWRADVTVLPRRLAALREGLAAG